MLRITDYNNSDGPRPTTYGQIERTNRQARSAARLRIEQPLEGELSYSASSPGKDANPLIVGVTDKLELACHFYKRDCFSLTSLRHIFLTLYIEIDLYSMALFVSEE